MSTNEISEDYKKMIADHEAQPFLRKIYNMHMAHPNDSEFGNKVRKLLFEIDDYRKAVALKKSNEDINRIMKNGSNF